MSNMSHCRFQNTLADLRDCRDAWHEPIDTDEEIKARQQLLKLCQKIVRNYGDEEED